MRQVWIVDDDDDMSQAIGLLLKVLECDVIAFRSARSVAQKLLTGKSPDVLLVDIHMPEVSGLDLLEFLRRRPEWKELPIVVLSSEAAETTVDQAIQLGADAYVTKPVTVEELEKAMHASIEKHLPKK